MDQAEASGKTVEDAILKAAAQLGLRREDVDFIILDEGTRGGLFKRARDAVVRVSRRDQPLEAEPSVREAPDTRIPHAPAASAPRQGQRSSREQREGREGAGARPRSDRPERSPRADRGRGGRGGGRNAFEQATPKLTEADFLRPRYDQETAAEPSAEPRGRRTERPSGGGGGGGAPARGPGRGGSRPPAAPRADSGERRGRREEEEQIEPDINAPEVDAGATIVDDILRMLTIDAEITIREPITPGDGRGMVLAVIDITGDDLGLLIGRRGDTLLSLQYLVNLILGKRYPGRGGVSIDVEHYRHRREEQLMTLAHRMADRVRESGSPITLEPMPPAERRLVHLALADDPDLETNSIGEGDNRKVVISARRNA